MKEDEQWLLKELYKEHLKKPEFKIDDVFDFFKPLPYKTPRDIIENQSQYNHKRLWYVMEKFYNKDIVDYGTSLGSAWLTDKGIELAKTL